LQVEKRRRPGNFDSLDFFMLEFLKPVYLIGLGEFLKVPSLKVWTPTPLNGFPACMSDLFTISSYLFHCDLSVG